MPENPLLPNRKLRDLYLLMLRCRDLERRQRAVKTGVREALLAAASIHLLPGDLLCGEEGDTTAEILAPVGKTGKTAGTLHAGLDARLTACAGAARGMTASATDGLVVAFTRAGAVEEGWQNSMTWANEEQLPLVLVCEDAVGGGKSERVEAITWTAMQAFVKKTRVPIIAVDGADAVAVYRVMQECVGRARSGNGAAVIWAVTSPKTAKVSRSQQPLTRLQSYLKARKIALPKRP